MLYRRFIACKEVTCQSTFYWIIKPFFGVCIKNGDFKEKNQVLVILSGPEPQRTLFEKQILENAGRMDKEVIVLRGKPEGKYLGKEQKDHIMLLNHANDTEFFRLVKESKHIICRSGYSTIMDLATMGKTALLIPTPGQTEQEYIARYLSAKKKFVYMSQKNFDMEKGIEMLEKLNVG
ncbi:MAG: hypothetical protein HC906_13740 [Bacteroidales bacterium]|nr:hypothetical protein [Bacteroidales bacterium]